MKASEPSSERLSANTSSVVWRILWSCTGSVTSTEDPRQRLRCKHAKLSSKLRVPPCWRHRPHRVQENPRSSSSKVRPNPGLPPYFLLFLRCVDNLVNQRLMLSMLKRLGYSADWANNGKEAVQRAQASYYPMIFMGEEPVVIWMNVRFL